MKKILLTTLGVALMGASLSANAANTATATINPSFTLLGACTVDAAGFNATFPGKSLGATGAVSTAADNVTVVCPGVPYKFGANAGTHWDGTSSRQLSDGTNNIKYKISIVGNTSSTDWGDFGLTTPTTPASMPALSENSGAPAPAGDYYEITLTIPTLAGTELAGVYTDTVTLTVEF